MKTNDNALLSQVKTAISDVLRIDLQLLSETTGAGDVHEWDSLGHLIVCSELERRFGKKFSISEILASRTVADLVTLLQSNSTAPVKL